MLIVLAASSGFAQQGTKPALQPAKVESLGTPVKSARFWTTGLAPNPRGGFNFIVQLYNYDNKSGGAGNTDWVILDLESGRTVKRYTFPGYANSNFRIENQLQAANGRIFFPVMGNSFCYYDPGTETMGMVGPLMPTSTTGPVFFYQNTFGPDGMLYSSTQANDGFAYLAVLNPDTLQYKVFDKIGGKVRKEMLTYGYWVDVDPPWAYVCVGQADWSLVAVNTETAESKILAEVNAPYRISFNSREQVRVAVTSECTDGTIQDGTVKDNVLYVPSQKLKTEYFWAVADKLIPSAMNYDVASLPFTPRSKKVFPPLQNTQTKALPAGTPPELDLGGLGVVVNNNFSVKWRPAGAAAGTAWHEVSFPLTNVAPIKIESLTALADGTLLGNAQQYNGFFRYRPAEKKMEYYGKFGPSNPVLAEAGGKIYFSGYPGGSLFVYDQTKPWISSFPADISILSKPEANPRLLGQFTVKTGTHYAYFLVAQDGRLYMSGRRERQGQGGGVGYYDIANARFEGTYANLNFLLPRGFAVLPAMKKVVYSGELVDDPSHPNDKPAEAQLVVYDMEIKEQKRLTVKPGLASTGTLCAMPSGKQVIGYVTTKTENGIYLFDMETEKLGKWAALTDPLDWLLIDPANGRWWGEMKGTLVLVNPATLEVTPKAALSRTLANPAFQGGVLYGTDGGELLKVTLPQ